MITLKKIVTKLQENRNTLLIVLALISIAAAAFSILTYGQTIVHSDTATATILAKAQLKDKSWFPHNWNYVYGDIWVVTINTFTFIFSSIMSNQVLARMLASALVMILMSIVVRYHSKQIFDNDSWVITIPAILLFIADSTVEATSGGGAQDCLLYQAPYMVFGLTIFIIYVLGYRVYNKKSGIAGYIVLGIATFIMCMNGIRFIAEITLPLMGTVVIYEFIKLMKSSDRKIKPVILDVLPNLLTVFLSSLAGWGVSKLITMNVHVRNVSANATFALPDSISVCLRRIKDIFVGFYKVFGYVEDISFVSIHGLFNIVAIIACTIFIFLVPLLQTIRIAKETESIKLFYIFVLVHNIVILMVMVLFGIGADGGRHSLTIVLLQIALSGRYIYEYWLKGNSIKIRFISIAWIIGVLFSLVMLLSLSAGWSSKLSAKRAIANDILERGITKGYATYWNAYSNEVYSDCKITYCGIDLENNWVTDYYWLCDTDSFYQEASSSCLALSDFEHDAWGDAKFQELFGEPIEILRYDNLYVYTYDYDIGHNIASGVCGGVNNPPVMEYDNATYSKDAILINPGGSAYGPNTHLFKGNYEVRFVGSNMMNADVDIFSQEHSDIATWIEVSRSENEIVLEITCNYERAMDIEYRIFNNTDSDVIELNYISIN